AQLRCSFEPRRGAAASLGVLHIVAIGHGDSFPLLVVTEIGREAFEEFRDLRVRDLGHRRECLMGASYRRSSDLTIAAFDVQELAGSFDSRDCVPWFEG